MNVGKGDAKSVIHEAVEAHLREEIRLQAAQSRADTRRINSENTFVFESGKGFKKLKRKQDETDAISATKELKKLNNTVNQ